MPFPVDPISDLINALVELGKLSACLATAHRATKSLPESNERAIIMNSLADALALTEEILKSIRRAREKASKDW